MPHIIDNLAKLDNEIVLTAIAECPPEETALYDVV